MSLEPIDPSADPPDVSGERVQLVVVRWPDDSRSTVLQLRARLKQAIDRKDSRVVVDLRAVEGVPQKLVTLMHHASFYARTQNSQISIRVVDPEMRRLLTTSPATIGGEGLPDVVEQVASQSGFGMESLASDAAAGLLGSRHNESFPTTGTSTESRSKTGRVTKRKPKRSVKDYVIFSGLIVVGTGLVGYVEWKIINRDDTYQVAMPEKGFENNTDDRLSEQEATIAEQREQIERQKNAIARLETQLSEMRRERDVLKEALRITRTK